MRNTIAGRLGAAVLALAVGTTAFAADAAREPAERYIVDAAPTLQVEPEYPPALLKAGTGGEVTVAFVIDVTGRVREPKVTASQPAGAFDAEALATIKLWRFKPANEPFACRHAAQPATQTFRFHPEAAIDRQVEVLPTVVEGIASPDRPVIRVHTADELRAALESYRPTAPLPESDLIPVERVAPDFPMNAIRKGIQGFVFLRFVVDAEGAVQDLEVTQSEPPGVFDANTKRAVKRWKFKPRVVDGVAVPRVACQHVAFQMEGV